jgi:hypothetical protein
MQVRAQRIGFSLCKEQTAARGAVRRRGRPVPTVKYD